MKKITALCIAWMCLNCTHPASLAQQGTTRAESNTPSNADFCRNGLFPREQESLSLGMIQGQAFERVHFLDDSDGCPSSGPRCMRRSYLVPGDEVLVGKIAADWACVWYQGRKHETVSWVPKKNVALRATPPSDSAKAWVGAWVVGPDRIEISVLKEKSRLQMQSSLRWDGGVLPNGERTANFGGMTGLLEVQGSKASAAEGDCQVRLTRLGNYLVVDDNGACGGINVRHTGVYLRALK